MASLRDEIGDFVGIPISFMEDMKQTAESRVVFMVLRHHTNRKSKRAFPGYETIMAESGLSRQKTAEGIKVLVGTGWLVKHKQFAKVTEYELCYPGRSYSSTGELRQGTPIVPPVNVVSSISEQPPYTSEQDRSNKIPPRVRAERQEKPIRKESAEEIAAKDPNAVARQELIDFLQERNPMPAGKLRGQKAAIEFMFGTARSSEQMIRCYEYLKTETWRTAAVTWQTVQTEIAGWVERGEPLKFEKNGNGAHGNQQSAADKSARNYKSTLAHYGIGVRPGSGEDSGQSEPRQVTSGAGPGRNGHGD